ncbi:MAG: hypothetical protein ABJ360_12100, partial [Roseobacter sp.]
MLKKRCNASEYWTTRLFEAKQAVDPATCNMAEPVSFVPEARTRAIVGQNAFMQTTKTFSALLGAGRQSFATLNRSVDTRDTSRLQATAPKSDGANPAVLASHKAEKSSRWLT